jgi:hypothetical protein
MNIGKGDPVLAVCPFDSINVAGNLFRYKAPDYGCPLMIAGNIQQIEFGFKNTNDIAIALAGKLYGILLEIETPSKLANLSVHTARLYHFENFKLTLNNFN